MKTLSSSYSISYLISYYYYYYYCHFIIYMLLLYIYLNMILYHIFDITYLDSLRALARRCSACWRHWALEASRFSKAKRRFADM